MIVWHTRAAFRREVGLLRVGVLCTLTAVFKSRRGAYWRGVGSTSAMLGLKGEAGGNPALSRNCDAAPMFISRRLSQVARHCDPYYHLRAKGGRNNDEAVDSGHAGLICPPGGFGMFQALDAMSGAFFM